MPCLSGLVRGAETMSLSRPAVLADDANPSPGPRPLPFLKWAGGKRWLARPLTALIRRCSFNRFIEPFVGSGAVFFALRPNVAVLADLNGELINTYKVIK